MPFYKARIKERWRIPLNNIIFRILSFSVIIKKQNHACLTADMMNYDGLKI